MALLYSDFLYHSSGYGISKEAETGLFVPLDPGDVQALEQRDGHPDLVGLFELVGAVYG